VHQIEHGIHGLGGGQLGKGKIKRVKRKTKWSCDICPRSCVPDWCPTFTCPECPKICPECSCPHLCPECPKCPTCECCCTWPPKVCTECPDKWCGLIWCWEMCNVSVLFEKCYHCKCLGPILECECDCMSKLAKYCSESVCQCSCYAYVFRCLDYMCTCQCVVDAIRNRCGLNWCVRKCCPCCIPTPPSEPTSRIDSAEVKFNAEASEMFNRVVDDDDNNKTNLSVPSRSVPEIAAEPSDLRMTDGPVTTSSNITKKKITLNTTSLTTPYMIPYITTYYYDYTTN